MQTFVHITIAIELHSGGGHALVTARLKVLPLNDGLGGVGYCLQGDHLRERIAPLFSRVSGAKRLVAIFSQQQQFFGVLSLDCCDGDPANNSLYIPKKCVPQWPGTGSFTALCCLDFISDINKAQPAMYRFGFFAPEGVRLLVPSNFRHPKVHFCQGMWWQPSKEDFTLLENMNKYPAYTICPETKQKKPFPIKPSETIKSICDRLQKNNPTLIVKYQTLETQTTALIGMNPSALTFFQFLVYVEI